MFKTSHEYQSVQPESDCQMDFNAKGYNSYPRQIMQMNDYGQ